MPNLRPLFRGSLFPVMFLLTLGPLLAAGCAGNGGGRDDGRLRVVTTVSPITNIVENIGGDRIRLEGIIPEGVNSHTFEPAPSDARLLAEADLIIVNGLHLELPTVELAEDVKKGGAEILFLGENTIDPSQYAYDFSFPEGEGDPNPHLWPNVPFAMRYAELIRDKLSELDPENAAYYRANAEAYLPRLEQLDRAIAEAVQTIPEEQRRLLTYHDSWAYFARRYGMTVVGAVQPSDFSEPSPQDLADLIRQIRDENVPSLFGSEVFPSAILEQIARETGAEYIDDLRDDDLTGKPGDPEHSYIGLMLANMRIMVPALGGDVGALEGIDPQNIVADSGAVYPQ